MESIWNRVTEFEERESLTGQLSAKAVVIGGGMAGILTAYLLQKQGVDVVVLEADRVGSGQTQNTTAKITSQHNLIYEYLIEKFGEEKAVQYAHANQQAIDQYQEIIEEETISCGFLRCPAYLYTLGPKRSVELENEAMAARIAGIGAEFTRETQLPFPVAGAVKFPWQAQFQPLEFLKQISRKLRVYEHTRVTKVEGHCVVTEQGMVEAEHVVFAVHYPWQVTPGYYFLRMHQERSYVLALELKEAEERDKEYGMYLGVDQEGCSFRFMELEGKHILLLGGGSHRTGENCSGGKYEMLREKADMWFPGSRELAHWSAQDCMSLDHIPYIGYFSGDIPNWYVATGFGKWGMTSSMAAAQIISRMVLGKEHEDEEVFAPQRFPVTALSVNLAENTAQAVKGLTKQLVNTEEFPPRCPHMGCKLEKNRDEGTFECPCHGSRFQADGTLLNGPAQKNLL